VADVAFENAPEANSGGGMLSYLHKVKDGSDIYDFANSSNDRVDTWVRFRGRHALEQWNPHTGTMEPCESVRQAGKGGDITRVRLVLEPVKSVFLAFGDHRPLEPAACHFALVLLAVPCYTLAS
jgi:hypothetical protein